MLTPIKTGNVGAVCNNSTGGKNFTENAFKSLLGQYGDGHGSLEEKQIDKLLEDINSTLRFRLTKKPVSLLHFQVLIFNRLNNKMAARPNNLTSILLANCSLKTILLGILLVSQIIYVFMSPFSYADFIPF